MKTKNEILAEIKFTLIKKHNIDALDDALINDCVDELLKAINYSQCCTQLKDKEKLTFDKWKFSKGIRYVSGHIYKDNDGDLYDSDELEKMYEHYLNL